jgi:hypothetical protein
MFSFSAAYSARRASIFHFCNILTMKNFERAAIAIMSAWCIFAVHEGVNSLVRAHNWQPMTISDWGTWVGSIGTVATLIGTIYLATNETRRRVRSELALAQIYAVYIRVKLNHSQARIGGARHALELMLKNEPVDRRALAISDSQIQLMDQINVEDAVALTVFENRAADMLIRAINVMDLVKHMSKLALVASDDKETAALRARDLIQMIENAQDMMNTTTKALTENINEP